MDIAKIVIFAVLIAAIATAIAAGAAFVMTYWPYLLGAAIVIFGLYFFVQKSKDERNKV